MATRPAYVYNGSGWDDIGDKRIGAEAGDIPQASVTDLTSDLASKLPYSYGTATPSTSDDGFLWYDDNDTPPTPKFWDGSAFVDFPNGLTLVASESFSAVSSVSVNGCFSSAYQNYRIIVDVTSLPASLSMRLRVASSDNSSANYETSAVRANINATEAFTLTGQTSWFLISNVSGATTGRASMDIFDPFSAVPTNGLGAYSHYNSNANTGTVGLRHTTSTSFDGFTLFPTSSTITGTLTVYGYKD